MATPEFHDNLLIEDSPYQELIIVERKISGISWESFVERQIREAQQKGEFDNLQGLGQPLSGLDEPWIKSWLDRNNIVLGGEQAELMREVENIAKDMLSLASEEEVIKEINSINHKILLSNMKFATADSKIGLISKDVVLQKWRRYR